MSFVNWLIDGIRKCFPTWLSPTYVVVPMSEGSAASTASKNEAEVTRPLTKDERLEVLKRALAEEYYCSGHPPFEVTGHKLMDCGCPEGTHGALVVTETGHLYYPA